MHCTPVKCDGFDRPVRFEQKRTAGRFIDTARLHSHETAFHEIEAPAPVFATQFVELGEHSGWAERLAVDADRVAFLKPDFHVFGRIRRIFWIHGALVHVIRRINRGVFQHLTFGRCVQEVRIDREWRFAAFVLGDWDLILLRKVDEFSAA